MVELALLHTEFDQNIDVKSVLRSNRFLGQFLSTEQIDRIAENSVELIIEKDHILHRVQQKPKQLYIIMRGVG